MKLFFPCGPAGVAIPIGLPLLIVIGYLPWKDANRVDPIPGNDEAPDLQDAPAPVTAPAGADARVEE